MPTNLAPAVPWSTSSLEVPSEAAAETVHLGRHLRLCLGSRTGGSRLGGVGAAAWLFLRRHPVSATVALGLAVAAGSLLV